MTGNEITGDSGAVVQAGVVHGDVHVAAPTRSGPPVPRQLPLAMRGFVNRGSQLAELDALAEGTEEPAEPIRSAVVSTIAGAPGVGKTALAVYWAHTARSRYSDGDLYIDMRGYGSGPRIEAAHALETLLRCLDVAPERIPADLDGRAAMYRSLLDGRRMLVLIDNVDSADQVRPLLPASPHCFAIVTSRSSLPGLITREGAQRMVLDALTLEESLALLRRVAGAERIDADPAAARRLARHCAFLPLALRITAERITARPSMPLTAFVAELDDERERLDALRTEDDELSDVRAVFSASYNELDADTARLFRRCGLHPGAEADARACAALADTGVSTARLLLDRLARVHLVTAVARDRYRFHDLLRLYAAERADQDEEPGERERALRRLLYWYLCSADNGHRVVLPAFHKVPIPDIAQPVDPAGFGGVDEAMDWFEAERENLVDAVRAARESGIDDLAWRLPAVMYGFFELRGYWAQWRAIHLVGIEAAEESGDQHGLACNRLGLGDANWLLKRTDEAFSCYRDAADSAARCADRWVEGFALRQTAVLLHGQGRYAEAAEAAERALAVFERGGEQRGAGMALLTLSDCQRDRGVSEGAVESCERALTLFRAIDDAWSLAWGRCALGRALSDLGRWPEALAHYTDALTTFRSFGNRRNEARALIGMGEACIAMGQREEAREHLRAAAALAEMIGGEQAADLKDRIRDLDAKDT